MLGEEGIARMKDFILRELENITMEMGLVAAFAEGFQVNYETDVYDLELSKKDLKKVTDGHKTLEVYWYDKNDNTREFICDLYEVEGEKKAHGRLMKGLLKAVKEGRLDVKEYVGRQSGRLDSGQKITKSGFIIPA